jgi:pilus assembly protein CpaC
MFVHRTAKNRSASAREGIACALALAALWAPASVRAQATQPGPAAATTAAAGQAGMGVASEVTAGYLAPSPVEGIIRLAQAGSAEDVIQPVLEMERGKTVVLQPEYRVKRIAVGDPEIVDFVVNGPTEVQLIAKSVGDTNVLIWDGNGRLQASIDIHVGAVRAQLVRELQRVLGQSDIIVDMARDSVVLRGSVPSLELSEAAETVARSFFIEEGGGGASSAAAGGQDGGTARVPQVVNLLSVGGNQQVMIEIVIAEMQRSVSRALGFNFNALVVRKDNPLLIRTMVRNLTTTTRDAMNNVTTTFVPDVKLIADLVNRDDFMLTAFIELAETEQLGKVLAEPTLVARSGELASFLAGGEIPIPIVDQNGDDSNVTIVFKRFGVQLEFRPTVLSPDKIHLQITPEVSQPDFSFGTTVGGTTVPAFRTRRAATGIDLADGQSFAIAGLLQELSSVNIERYPLLGDVPILGQLFSSNRFMKNETELVIIATPRLVKPLGPDAITLPTDYFVLPSEFEFYVLGRSEGRPRNPNFAGQSPSAQAAPESQPGGLIGDFGHRIRVPEPSQEGI